VGGNKIVLYEGEVTYLTRSAVHWS